MDGPLQNWHFLCGFDIQDGHHHSTKFNIGQNLCEKCFQIYFFRPNDYEPFKGETWLKHSFVRWSFSKCIDILEGV